MKRILLMLAATAAMVACNCNESCKKECNAEGTVSATTEMASVAPVNLIGKAAVITYPELKAEIQYLSENQVHWKTTDKDGKVEEETNPAFIRNITPTVIFVNWVENSGMTISQVVDTEKDSVTVYGTVTDEKATNKRAAMVMEGSWQLQQ